jgi:hypothetical protein
MMHHRTRAAGLLVIVASLVLAPGALASAPANVSGPAKAKERAYGKHCGAKRQGAGRSASRAKCVEALSRLATGKSSSPHNACRALSRKKAKGQRKSPFALCVSAGARLLKSKGARHSNGDSGAGGHDEGEDPELDQDESDEAAADDNAGREDFHPWAAGDPEDSASTAGPGSADPDDDDSAR